MEDVRWLDEREERAWRAYRRMQLLLGARLARDLAEDSGLSEPDYEVLSNLSEADGHRSRLTELASRMLWSRSRLSHHITRMAQRGLVRREDCATDGRGAEVVLVPEGLAALEAAAPLHVASVRAHLVDLLTDEQLDVLADIAEVVVDHLADGDRSPGDRPSAG